MNVTVIFSYSSDRVVIYMDRQAICALALVDYSRNQLLNPNEAIHSLCYYLLSVAFSDCYADALIKLWHNGIN